MNEFMLAVLVVGLLLYALSIPKRLSELRDELNRQRADYERQQRELQQLRGRLELLQLTVAQGTVASPPAPAAATTTAPAPAAAPPVAAPPVVVDVPRPVVAPAAAPASPAPPVTAPPRPAAPPALPTQPVPTPVAPRPPVVPVPVLATTETTAPKTAAPAPAAPAPVPVAPRRPLPPPVPAGPTWWERASAVLLENWTGILGAVVLVTGVGFLGIYTALRMSPPYRFGLICLFAVGLLGTRYALRRKDFARQLNTWLLSSAAAIFLFACVGAVSIPGLRWVLPPFDYLLLLAGVSANLYLAWRTSRQEVSTLHGVLSLVALAVLPPTALTLGTAAGITAFSIAITYRQRWPYQLLLSIVSLFVFHLHWHRQLGVVPEGLRLVAIGLVLLVGVAAALVQYRRVYAQRRFEPLLFAAHLLNWTCLGISLYLNSTGSPWKTVPLALGAVLTYYTGQHAKRLGITWLFQTDTILCLMLALGAALSLQGWQATPTVIGLFMLLESLLVALVMARQGEALVFRVAMSGALLAGAGLLLPALAYVGTNPLPRLYRDALALTLAGWAMLSFVQLLLRQPLLTRAASGWLGADAETGATAEATAAGVPAVVAAATEATGLHRQLVGGLAAVGGLLQLGAGGLLALAVFGRAGAAVGWLLPALALLAGAAWALAGWVRQAALAPGWVRQQQVVVGQVLAALAVLGLHKLGLNWPTVLLALYAETLVALLAFARRDSLLHRAGLGAALLAGSALLLAALNSIAGGLPATLYRDAALLALAAGLSLAFVRHSYRQPAAEVDDKQVDSSLLGGLAGMGGLLQAGAGLLLVRVVFHWAALVPGGYGLVALLVLAALALAAARWLGRTAATPTWVLRQQLVLGHYAVVLAILGLHSLGLSWPGVALVLYAEGLLAALLLDRSTRHDDLLHLQVYVLVAQALTLPLLVRYTSPAAPLGAWGRAALLAAAALLTIAYQLRYRYLRRPPQDYARLPLGAAGVVPLLGLAVGWLLLGAGSLVYEQPVAGWATLAGLGGLLALRRRVAVPGLGAGLLLAATGYLLLQWSSPALWPSSLIALPYQLGYAPWSAAVSLSRLLYLLPTALLLLVALATYWWPAGSRYLRWPWLYLLALHLLVAVAATATTPASAMLLVLALALAAFGAALAWRRTLPDAGAVARAGQPDRHLLHVAYALLLVSFGLHLRVLAVGTYTFFGQPAEYLTAAALFAALAGLALAPAPTTDPVYRSWYRLHPWLPEAALLFGTATLLHELRWSWQPLVWVSGALLLSQFGGRLPLHFRRLAVYGLLYYWLAAGTAAVVCLTEVSPASIGQPAWWALLTAVALLFGYVALALRPAAPVLPPLPQPWATLAALPRRSLEAALLYPAFAALSLLLIQSFDRSVLTVLLMLEVVAVFSTSLLLRRQDLRYVALAGMLGCLVRLVFFDLSRSGTITRAIVFIFMGLLLLGMNALYARFKARLTGEAATETEEEMETLEQ